jgi:two-component system response regulator TtrR
MKKTMKSGPIVYVVDHEKECCETIKKAVESFGLTCRTFGRGEEFLQNYDPSQYGCLILELRMPEISGLMFYEILQERRITLPTIFITAHGTVALAVRVMKMGAFDFLEKPISNHDLLERIDQAILLDRRRQAYQKKRQEYLAQIETLSQRESQILGAIIAGKNNKMIALELKISHKTVEFHRTNIMRKLKAETLVELTKKYLMLTGLDHHSDELLEKLNLKRRMSGADDLFFSRE